MVEMQCKHKGNRKLHIPAWGQLDLAIEVKRRENGLDSPERLP